nr:hypothetical protein [Tanacetum cinerariifolium]
SRIKLAAVNENKNSHLHWFPDACKGIPQRSKGAVAEAAGFLMLWTLIAEPSL